MTSLTSLNNNIQQQLNPTQASLMMKIAINLNEKDIIKLIIEFLHNRELNISMLDLERETGIINSAYSDDILFLRQLILDGQWDDAIEFIQPLKQIETFNTKQFYYSVLKSQYLELLCLKSEANTVDNQLSVDQLVTYLNDLKQYCPNDEEYKKLCLLLTSPRIQDQAEYRNWNPSSGRLQCFKDILPLISKFLPTLDPEKNVNQISQNERLIQLIVKGLLYESCVEYCQARATNSPETYNISDPHALLMNQNLSETDASLLSWLHALALDTFSCPFEEKPLKLNLDKFIKPTLEATWAESILATPIKPQQLFPYNAVPSGRSRNAELMSRSLAPQYEGLTFGLTKSQLFTSGIEMKLNSSSSGGGGNAAGRSEDNRKVSDLVKNTSQTSGGSEINTSGNYNILNGIKEEEFINSPTGSTTSSSNSSSNNNNNIKSSGSGMPAIKQTNAQPVTSSVQQSKASLDNNNTHNSMHDSALFLEYRKHKQQIIQQIEEQERKRDEYVKQLKTPNVHNALSSLQTPRNAPAPASNNGSKANEDELSFLSPKSPRDLNDIMQNMSLKSNNVSNEHLNNSNTRENPVAAKSPSLHTSSEFITSPSQLQSSKHSNNSNTSLKQVLNNNNESSRYESLDEIIKAATFLPICTIEDQQAIRAVDVHPSGNFYVVGSNSKCLRICPYPNLNNIKSDNVCKPASVLYKKGKHHYGSIYCTAWNPTGNLIATGSNDKTIKLFKFTPDLTEDNDSETEIAFHNGTVRDLIFMQQHDNNILISGGAGDCKINVLDCATQQTLRNYAGHSGHIFSLYTWAGTKNVFVSGSQDKTCKFWDLRTPDAIQTVAPTTTLALQGSPVAALAVDPSGLLLATGHEDSACCLYDIRGSRIVQIFKPHASDVRSVRFPPTPSISSPRPTTTR